MTERKTKNCRLLAVQLTDHTGEPGVSTMLPITRVDGHGLYRFTSATDGEDAEFHDRLDEWILLRLIMHYRLDLKDVV